MKPIIEKLSSSDTSSFMARFCELPEKLVHNNHRPLPKKEYWGYLLSVFPEVKKELFIASCDGKDVGEFWLILVLVTQGLLFLECLTAIYLIK